MRKRLITPIPQDASSLVEGWLDLDGAAVFEVTSEEEEYPVEAALVPGKMRGGWRAADSPIWAKGFGLACYKGLQRFPGDVFHTMRPKVGNEVLSQPGFLRRLCRPFLLGEYVLLPTIRELVEGCRGTWFITEGIDVSEFLLAPRILAVRNLYIFFFHPLGPQAGDRRSPILKP